MAGIVVKLRNCAIPDEELPANCEFRPSSFVLRPSSLHPQPPSRRRPVILSEVPLAVELLGVEHRPVDADEDVVERTLAADAEAALHIALDAQLGRDAPRPAETM